MKKIKKFILFLAILLPLFFITVNVNAASFHQDIQTEVAAHVSAGRLPSYHNNLSGDTGYQTLYTKMLTSNNLDYFKTISEQNLRSIIMWYHTDSDLIWKDVKANLDIEPKYLEPNKVLGIYWDSRIDETYSYLYLIWTSEYIPTEFMTIKELVLNNKTYKQYDTEAQKDNLDGNWYGSDYYHYAGYNLTLHKTPIAVLIEVFSLEYH